MKFLEKLNKVLSSLSLTEKAKGKDLQRADWDAIAAEYKKQFGSNFYSDAEIADDKKVAAYNKVAKMLNECNPEEDPDKKKSEDDSDKKKKKDDEDPENDPEKDPDENPDDNPDENPDENPDDNPDENPDENPDDNPDENPDENPDDNPNDEDDPDKKKKKDGNQSIVKGVSRLLSENKKLKSKLKMMANKAGHDAPRNIGTKAEGLAMASTDKYLFGIEHPLFSMSKRWNRISRNGAASGVASSRERIAFREAITDYSESLASRMLNLQKAGHLNIVSLSGNAVDVNRADLTLAGLGNQYLVRRQDELIARLLMVPTVFDVFPKRSNVQDGDLITNAFFGEFSQGYQAGEISKGDVSLQPEKAKVHKVMSKILFKDMTWLETEYIGYLNTTGSDPVKWNMIEWMVLNIGQKLIQEQSKRYVMGYRVEPVEGKNQPYLLSSTGVVNRLLSYVDDHKVLPIFDADFSTYTHITMYDVVDNFVDAVAEHIDNFTGKAIYLNKNHKKFYMDSYRTKFGHDLDFQGSLDKVMGREDLEIVWVPNMGNLMLMFITDKGNFQTLEDLPGEMTKVYFEQRLENIWAASYWKEGVAAAYAGKKYATKEALVAAGYEEQAIFMNWPSIAIAADATTVDVKKGIIFTTSANTVATAITDLTNTVEGMVYTIICGSTANASTIAKSGKFENLTAAWSPEAVGSYLKVYYDKSTSKFVEVARG